MPISYRGDFCIRKRLSHGCFHIGTYIKPERRYLPEKKSRAGVDRGLDIGADMKTGVMISLPYDRTRPNRQVKII